MSSESAPKSHADAAKIAWQKLSAWLAPDHLAGLRPKLHYQAGILAGFALAAAVLLGIADLATFLRPTLTLLDAYRVLTANGPQGGNLNDVKLMKTLVAGIDPVAIDAYGATLLGLRPEQIPYLSIAHERGLGNRNYTELPVKYSNIAG